MSQQAEVQDRYHELWTIIQNHGWFEKATGRVLFQLAIHLFLYLGGIALFLAWEHWAVRALSLLISAYGGVGISTNSHTSSHNATSDSPRLNRALTYFGFTFMLGVSASFWWNKHCVVHHPSPNVIGVDDDADLMPFFAVNEAEFQQAGLLRRLYFRIQLPIFVLALSFNGFFTQYQGLRYLFSILADRSRRRTSHWIDLGLLGLYALVWVVLPMFFFAPLHVLGFHALRYALMGYGMFIAFAPAHYPPEALYVHPGDKTQDYLLGQIMTTVNFRTGFLGRLFCAGVDYQIEHHLFPIVPHVHYPEMSKVVKEFCDRYGYPYQTLSWGEAILKSFSPLVKQKQIYELEAYQTGTGGRSA